MLERGDTVIGIDNLNDYYAVELKKARLNKNCAFDNYTHDTCSLQDRESIDTLFRQQQPQRVIHLAAQPGVRYSLQNPYAYIDNNIVGFMNILEACRQHKVEHLVYASSSSVYGANSKLPFSTHDPVDHPVSMYAATKRANELMAHTYSHLYQLPTIGLRFFYGLWPLGPTGHGIISIY